MKLTNHETIFFFSFLGKALCFALAKEGIHVTVVDYSEGEGQEVAFLIGKEIEKFYPGLKFPSSIFVKCDVTNAGKHLVYII